MAREGPINNPGGTTSQGSLLSAEAYGELHEQVTQHPPTLAKAFMLHLHSMAGQERVCDFIMRNPEPDISLILNEEKKALLPQLPGFLGRRKLVAAGATLAAAGATALLGTGAYMAMNGGPNRMRPKERKILKPIAIGGLSAFVVGGAILKVGADAEIDARDHARKAIEGGITNYMNKLDGPLKVFVHRVTDERKDKGPRQPGG